MASEPHSFIQRNPSLKSRWKLRTTDDVEATLSHIAATCTTKSQREKELKEEGFYDITYALQPSIFPHFLAFEGSPQDAMHAEFSSGIGNYELAEFLYLGCKIKWFTVEDLNHAIDDYNWPAGHKPPHIYPSIVKGDKNGCPLTGAHMHYSGSQTMHFMLDSIELLMPFVKDATHPAWISWCAHVAYVKMLVAPNFTEHSIKQLDLAVAHHQRLYYNVKEYGKRYKPKHHFATHYAREILNWGPPRLYWCFGYEAKNQEVKQAGAASNFKDCCGTAMKILAFQSARSLKKRTREIAQL